MNNVTLIGRLTKDPEIRQGTTTIARYTLAVDRKYKRDGEPTADFIRCVAFGKSAEFAGKWLHKGIKIGVIGRIQTGSYKDRNGDTVFTTDVVIENQEFVENKTKETNDDDDFMRVPKDSQFEFPF